MQSRGGPPFQNRGKVENRGSLISFHIVVRLHVPQNSFIWVVRRVKIAHRLPFDALRLLMAFGKALNGPEPVAGIDLRW